MKEVWPQVLLMEFVGTAGLGDETPHSVEIEVSACELDYTLFGRGFEVSKRGRLNCVWVKGGFDAGYGCRERGMICELDSSESLEKV